MTAAQDAIGAPSGALPVSGADIVATARGYLGAKWAHQARRDDAMDCAGLVIKVAHDLGLTQFDKTDYPRLSSPLEMLSLCRDHLVEIRRADLRLGDVVVLSCSGNPHIGIIGDYKPSPGVLTMIHAQARHPRQVVEAQFNDVYLQFAQASVIGCFRYPGVVA